jgi:TPR repeat protein
VKALIWGAIFEDKIKEEQHLLEAMKHGHVDAYYDYIQMTAAVDTTAADSAAYSEGDYWYADSAAVDSAADEYYEWEDLAYHFTKWWYEKGEADFKETLAKAKQGDVEAQYQAGYTYYEITLVEDIESSIYWLKKAAQQKHVEAANLLGKIYIEKRKDYAEAYKYIKIAADGGLPNGKLFLGVFHFIGLECKEDTDLAFRLWEEAAKSDKESQDFLKELQGISNGVLIQ